MLVFTKRGLLQYFVGFFLMSLGVVLTKRSDLGLSPFSTAPAAMNTIFPSLSLGTTTIIIHLVCIAVMICCQRKATLKTALTFIMAFPFGWLVDALMMVIGPMDGVNFWLRLLVNCVGIVINAFGVTCIVGAELMLPAPDAMLRVISVVFHKKYSTVKNCGDIFWVCLSAITELIVLHKLVSVGIGTVLAAIFVGRLIKLFNKKFPQLPLTSRPIE